MGVNDLAGEWRSAPTGPGDEDHQGGLDTAATSLEMGAEECWHPVSEPPTEEDADYWDMVAVYWDGYCKTGEWAGVGFDVAEWDELPAWATHWARIRDVVLLPPE